MATRRRFQISDGPSKWDLMLALFDNSCQKPRTVKFTIKHGFTELSVCIDRVEREDGSGESWNFKGYNALSRSVQKVHGYFSTRQRTGWLEIE